MSNPRTDIDELKLQGATGNLRRALKRDKSEADAPLLSDDEKSELEQLNLLIAQSLKCCRRGATFNKKKNPAFANLAQLMKCRDLLLRGKKSTGKKSVAEIMADADRLVGGVN